MGAVYQGSVIELKDIKDLRNTFHRLCEDDAYECGHGGYTGTFAEKPSVELMRGIYTKEQAREHCEEHNDKWGPAFAYCLGDNKYYIGGWCSC